MNLIPTPNPNLSGNGNGRRNKSRPPSKARENLDLSSALSLAPYSPSLSSFSFVPQANTKYYRPNPTQPPTSASTPLMSPERSKRPSLPVSAHVPDPPEPKIEIKEVLSAELQAVSFCSRFPVHVFRSSCTNLRTPSPPPQKFALMHAQMKLEAEASWASFEFGGDSDGGSVGVGVGAAVGVGVGAQTV